MFTFNVTLQGVKCKFMRLNGSAERTAFSSKG